MLATRLKAPYQAKYRNKSNQYWSVKNIEMKQFLTSFNITIAFLFCSVQMRKILNKCIILMMKLINMSKRVLLLHLNIQKEVWNKRMKSKINKLHRKIIFLLKILLKTKRKRPINKEILNLITKYCLKIRKKLKKNK